MSRAVFWIALAALTACNPRPAAAPGSSRVQASSAAHATASALPSPSPSGLPPLVIKAQGNAHQPVRIVEQQGNRKLYELIARSTESSMQSQNQFRGTFAQTHVTFYDTDGTTLQGDAPTTTIDKASSSVVMQGGVNGKTSTGITLQCDQLTYDRRSGQLRGVGNVHIVGAAGYSLSGGSFTSDLRLTHVHME